jgi:hypothetical protein
LETLINFVIGVPSTGVSLKKRFGGTTSMSGGNVGVAVGVGVAAGVAVGVAVGVVVDVAVGVAVGVAIVMKSA